MKYSRSVRNLLSTALLWAWVCLLGAQEPTFTLTKVVPLKAERIEADNLGDLYVLYESEISKYTSSGVFVMKNSQKLLGEISDMDATNALKMLVYFRDLSQIQFLDNQLGTRGDVVNLDVAGFIQVISVCTSYNNGIWLFDQVRFELVRLNEQLRITNNTPNLFQILGADIEPSYMRESNRQLFVGDPQNGIYVFDLFGTFYKRIPVQGVEKFSVAANNLYFLKDQALWMYNLRTFETQTVPLPMEGVTDLVVQKQKLTLLTDEGLYIYTIHL